MQNQSLQTTQETHPDDHCSHGDRGDPLHRLCQVCNAPGNGNFFGAFVCFPCKTFFSRHVNNKSQKAVCESLGQCPVDASNRSICKACRYAKCLAVGMSRKERPEVMVPSAGQKLCSVCGDIASNVHFGIISCEGCKKFFRRSAREWQEPCKFDGKCVINPRTRNNCRSCRLKKCVEVGMSVADAKLGRPKKRMTEAASADYYSGRNSHEGENKAASTSVSLVESAAENNATGPQMKSSFTDRTYHIHYTLPQNEPTGQESAGTREPHHIRRPESNAENSCNTLAANHNGITERFDPNDAFAYQSASDYANPQEKWKMNSTQPFLPNSFQSYRTACDPMPTEQDNMQISARHLNTDMPLYIDEKSPLENILKNPKDNHTEDLDTLIGAFSKLNGDHGMVKAADQRAYSPALEWENNGLKEINAAPHVLVKTHHLNGDNNEFQPQHGQSKTDENLQDNGEGLKEKLHCAKSILSAIRFSQDQLIYIESYWVSQCVPLDSVNLSPKDTLQILQSYRDFAQTYMTPDRLSSMYHQYKADKKVLWELARERVILRMKFGTKFISSLPGFARISDEDKAVICRLVGVQLGLIVASNILYDKEDHSFTMNFFDNCQPRNIGYTSDPHVKFTSICLELAKQLNSLQLSVNESAFVCALLVFATDYCRLRNPDIIEEIRKPIVGAFLCHTDGSKGDAVERARSILQLMPPVRKLGIWHSQWQALQSSKDGSYKLASK